MRFISNLFCFLLKYTFGYTNCENVMNPEPNKVIKRDGEEKMKPQNYAQTPLNELLNI